MAQPSSLIISQDTIGTGIAGESWKGGSSVDAGGGFANLVRIINTNPQSANTDIKLLWVPHDGEGVKLDTNGEGSLNQVGPHEWTFEPTALVWGKWEVRAREVVGSVNVDERRVFGIRSPLQGLLEPAFNEAASLNASLLQATPSEVADSEDNEGGTINGWQKDLRRMAEKIEALGGAADAGAVLLGTTWEFDDVDQADTDPGSNKFKLNHVTPSSATAVYFDIQSKSQADVSDILAALDVGAFIYAQQKSDSTRWLVFQVTGPAVDNGNFAWVGVPVAHVGVGTGSAVQTGEDVEFMIFPGGGGGGGPDISATLSTAGGDPLTVIATIPNPASFATVFVKGFLQASSPITPTFSRRWDFVAGWSNVAGTIIGKTPAQIISDPWAIFASGIGIVFDEGSPANTACRILVSPDAVFAFDWSLELNVTETP